MIRIKSSDKTVAVENLNNKVIFSNVTSKDLGYEKLQSSEIHILLFKIQESFYFGTTKLIFFKGRGL
jgi:hypothetical protein